MGNSEEEAVRQLRQGQLAGRLREELDDILGKEERRIINAVLSQLNAGADATICYTAMAGVTFGPFLQTNAGTAGKAGIIGGQANGGKLD